MLPDPWYSSQTSHSEDGPGQRATAVPTLAFAPLTREMPGVRLGPPGAPPRGTDGTRRVHDRLPCPLPFPSSVLARHVLKEARQQHAHDVWQQRGPLLGRIGREAVHDRMRRPEMIPSSAWSGLGTAEWVRGKPAGAL